MKSCQMLKIKLEREEKDKLDAAAEVLDEILAHLVNNSDNGFTPFQEGLDIYDGFWKIYEICRKIDDCDLIP